MSLKRKSANAWCPGIVEPTAAPVASSPPCPLCGESSPDGTVACLYCSFPLTAEGQAQVAERERIARLALIAPAELPPPASDRVACVLLALSWPGLTLLTPWFWCLPVGGLAFAAYCLLRSQYRRARGYFYSSLVGFGLWLVGLMGLLNL